MCYIAPRLLRDSSSVFINTAVRNVSRIILMGIGRSTFASSGTRNAQRPEGNADFQPFLPWNMSEEKKKELRDTGVPEGNDTS
jgi:hypothetical protein